MQKTELQQQAIAVIEQLSTEELKVVIDLLTDLQNRQAGTRLTQSSLMPKSP